MIRVVTTFSQDGFLTTVIYKPKLIAVHQNDNFFEREEQNMAFQFSISLKRLVELISAIIVVLMTLHIIVVITDQLLITSELLTVLQKDLKLLFDFNLEANVPTFFSTIMLFSCATILAVITLVKKQNGEKFAAHWGFLSIIFYLLSLDERLKYMKN